ncbi:hypothetical protein LWI29_007301 [Acer saccharum]|uniref:non-specific serine/threonine protein kinase n=1 Tax=Acer saccharum TaxID=4024 RepID=A0AA39VUL8_ACESA|nr:hypothetical protein LWI29_007301 [Acer saccharum]
MGPVILYRAGSWNGVQWTGSPQLKPNPLYTYNFVSNEKEVFYTYDARILTRLALSPSGVAQRLTWLDETHQWVGYYAKMRDECSNYSICGAYASCNINNFPICTCFNWSAGCIRKTPLDCQHGDGFVKHEAVKLPDTSHSSTVKYISLVQCKKLCINNCSCTAYATLDIREGGSGCLLWFTDLFDITDIEGGQVLYVRVAASEAEIDGIESERQPSRKKQLANTIIIVTSIISGIGVLAIVWIIYMWRKKLRNEGKPDDSHGMNDNREGSRKDDNGLTIYAWNTISDATDNFSDENKLGEGGFGPVYKGILIEGQEIAVKRLSKYFGMARTFGGDQTEAETNRVVGTYGYMSPEYIVDGIFSMKSDVYSFGVLVLEIVSGKRNRGFYHTDHKHNLLGHAWRLWNEEKALELIDKSLDYSSDSSEILRCIHIGAPQLKPNPVYTYEFVSNEKEVFFTFDIRNISVPSRMAVTPYGDVQRFTWIDRTHTWARFSAVMIDLCDKYALCGSNGSCNINKSPAVCECLEGFTPKSPREWEILDWTEGCVRRALPCNHSDGFLKYEAVKLPDTSHSWVDNNISLEECEKLCLDNCSCTAYANSDVREGGTGCLLWFSDLLDIRKLTVNGQPLYVRVAASELDNIDQTRRRIAQRRQLSEKKRVIFIVACVISAMGLLVLGWIIFMWKRKVRNQGKTENSQDRGVNTEETRKDDNELLTYDLNTIVNATDNFADKNKLGEGGFGPVYKAWRVWNEGRAVELIDQLLDYSSTSSEILRCIHIGLLCVQQGPEDRPNMSTVALMLGGEGSLPKPKQPGFFTESNHIESESSSSKQQSSSTNDITISMLEPR